MTEHPPPPASDPAPPLGVDARPAPHPISPAPTAEEARRPALALLDRLHQADAITLTELTRGRSEILRGGLDELLVPALGAEAPPPISGTPQGAPPAAPSIGEHLRAQGVLR